MDSETGAGPHGDRVERTIEIDADAGRVWELVSEPGWFVNDGTIRAHTVERDGDVSTVHDDVHGTFRIRTVHLEAPRYAAYRWLGGLAEEEQAGGPAADASTLVEFWIEPLDGGGVRLRVAESGFAGLAVPADERRQALEDNDAGWQLELEAARTHLTGGPASGPDPASQP